MSQETAPTEQQQTTEELSFETLRDEQQLSLPMEFLLFLKDNKKWWLTPILLVMALIATLVYFSASGAAPFIYSLF